MLRETRSLFVDQFIGESMNTGMTAALLMRSDFNMTKFESCVKQAMESNRKDLQQRLFRKMSKVLDSIESPISNAQKRLVMREAGKLQRRENLIIINNTPQILVIKNEGAGDLAQIIIEQLGGDISQETYFNDMDKVLTFAQLNRQAILHNLFEMYYNSSDFADCTWEVWDYSRKISHEPGEDSVLISSEWTNLYKTEQRLNL